MADTLMQAVQAFSCSLDTFGRVPFAVGAGDVFSADDDVVKRFPANFRPVTVRDSAEVRRPLRAYPGAGEETATAGPGERRSLTRPPRRGGGSSGVKAEPVPATTPAPAAAGPSEV